MQKMFLRFWNIFSDGIWVSTKDLTLLTSDVTDHECEELFLLAPSWAMWSKVCVCVIRLCGQEGKKPTKTQFWFTLGTCWLFSKTQRESESLGIFFHCVTRILKMPAQAKRRRIGEVSDKDSTSSLDESDADYQDEDPSEDPKVFFWVLYHTTRHQENTSVTPMRPVNL